jgi:hypothetical protein
MSWQKDSSSGKLSGRVVALIGIVGLIIAALNWLYPFAPVGTSPLFRQRGDQSNTFSQPVPIDRTNITESCQEIIGRLPHSPHEIRLEFAIPADKRIWLFYEICQEAPNGFVVEDSPPLFTLQVPIGGCIDSYSGAQFSSTTVPELLGEGRRAYSGSVTTTSLTYRIAGCELKP